MKSLIIALTMLLLVNACTGESPESAPVAQAEQAEQAEQTEQTEQDGQANQDRHRTRRSLQKETTSAYQNAIQARTREAARTKTAMMKKMDRAQNSGSAVR